MNLKPNADQMDSDLPELDNQNNIDIKSELNRLISLANNDESYNEYKDNILDLLLKNIDYDSLIQKLDVQKLLKSIELEEFNAYFDSNDINPIHFIDNIMNEKHESFHVEFINELFHYYNTNDIFNKFEILHMDDIEKFADLDQIIKNNGLIYEDDITEDWALDMFDDLIHKYDSIHYVNEDEVKQQFNLFSKNEILVYNPFTEEDISRAWK